jgi:hypothetical protein
MWRWSASPASLPSMATPLGNIEAVARAICARLYARHWPPGPKTDADIERHWHVVAARLELASSTRPARIRGRSTSNATSRRTATGAHATRTMWCRLSCRNPRLELVAHGTRRFVTAADSVAAAGSKVAEGEMLRAIT